MEVATRPETERRLGYADEAVVAELIDRLEFQASQLDHLREELASSKEERDRFKHELEVAESWVRELAAQLEEAQAQDRPASLRARIGA